MGFDAADWLTRYGYTAVLIGTFLEGETILVAGAIAAQRGMLDLRGVALAGLCGSFAGDQLYFFCGRWLGHRWLKRSASAQRTAERIFRLLARYQNSFILVFRFLYGLRTVAPFVLGASKVPARVYVPLNFIGALVWSCTMTFLGAALGNAVQGALQNSFDAQLQVIAVAVAVPALLAAYVMSGRRWS